MRAGDPQSRRLALLDHTEQAGSIGSWEWSPQTAELRWSDNLFRLFGLTPNATRPSLDYVRTRVHPADHAQFETTLTRMVAGQVSALEYRIVSAHGVVRHLRATVGQRDPSGDDSARLSGAVQDVTSQRGLALGLAAHVAVSTALEHWEDFASGGERLLAGLASAIDVPFGTLWTPGPRYLTARLVWHDGSQAALETATRAWHPGRGVSLLGRAWMGREPVIRNHPSLVAPPARDVAMRAAGITGAIALPAVDADETLAILEFLSVDRVEPSEHLLSTLHGIGHAVGYFLARRRCDLEPAVLTPCELGILRLAASGRSTADIAIEMGISPSTVKRHLEDTYARLGVAHRTEAVAQAIRSGLIT